MIDPNNLYTKMQQGVYDDEAEKWSPQNKNPVVGNWDAHESSTIYDNLFTNIDTKDMIALDFATGPGRNLVRYHNRFKRIDGCDISDININRAITWMSHNNINANVVNLYKTNGTELDGVPDDIYDMVFSTIAMQHICVWEIRYNLFQEMYRVLKEGGILSVQMGYGHREGAVGYYDNNYSASGTNGNCDVMIKDEKEIREDLEKIGFKDFSYTLTDCVSDAHSRWIFFRAVR